ncbi:MAG: branched-chain amino acid ABC transporter permease [Hyphomicrobiales bacterium]|nr:branched-chain amino acid ABC transporter permease [Hyphomicrobiales bacterium]
MEFIVGMFEGFFANPAKEIWNDPLYFVQNMAGGLMVGILYSLVALGFVLIYKASGVFNFAQPMMAIFGTLGLIFFHDKVLYPALGSGFGLTIVLAIVLAMAMMAILAVLVERLILRPLVNQEEIILFMVTIGLYYFLEGFGETLFNPIANSPVPMEALGIQIGPVFFGDVMFQKVDMTAAGVSAVMVILLALMFQKTPIGRALRAVADDHQAAQSVGIPLSFMWVVVWTFAGAVALVAGVMWGASAGAVDFGMVFVALKALPVLILGGFTSVPGVIVGGLIIGVGERLAEIYWSPYLGDSIETWFAYIIALIILFFRPEGLFGEKLIERI